MLAACSLPVGCPRKRNTPRLVVNSCVRLRTEASELGWQNLSTTAACSLKLKSSSMNPISSTTASCQAAFAADFVEPQMQSAQAYASATLAEPGTPPVRAITLAGCIGAAVVLAPSLGQHRWQTLARRLSPPSRLRAALVLLWRQLLDVQVSKLVTWAQALIQNRQDAYCLP